MRPLLLALAGLLLATSASAAERRPNIILILADRRLPFGRQHADDPAGDLFHTDALANRIFRSEQVGYNGLAEHANLRPEIHIVV